MQGTLIVVCVFMLLPIAGSITLPGHFRAAVEGANDIHYLPRPHAEAFESIRARGIALAEQGRFAEATTVFERGHLVSVESGNNRDTIRFLTYLANIQLKQSHYRTAMEGYQRARKLADASRDREMAGVSSAMISSLYLALGSVEEAEVAVEKALEAIPADSCSEHLPGIMLLRGRIYALQGEMDQATSWFRQAIGEADRHGNAPILARAWNELGYESLKSGELEAAESALVEAFRLMKMNGTEVPDRLYQDLGVLRMVQGDLGSASRLLERAFNVAKTTRSTVPLWSLYYRRAQVNEARGELDKALADLENALAHIRGFRFAPLRADSIRIGTGVGLDPVYDFFINTAARLYFETGRVGLVREAFEVAEENRAAALRVSLGETGEMRRLLPVEYWETLDRLTQAENSLFRSDSPDQRRRLGRLRQQLTEMEFQAGWRLADESGGNGMVIRAASLVDVQRALAESEALFSFHLSEPDSHLWALTRDRFELILLPGREQIDGQVSAFRGSVEQSSPEAVSLGERLSAVLFGNVAAGILDKPDWVLILDGSLFELPFPAIVVARNGEAPVYLLERHSLRVLPTAAFRITPPPDPWLGPMVAVSDPIYNTADPRWEPSPALATSRWKQLTASVFAPRARTEAVRQFQLTRLAGSVQEARACANAFRSSAAGPILLAGKRANSAEIEASLGTRPSVVHFATHVVASPENPDEGYIALSLDPDGELELLSRKAVFRLPVNSGLVVMSGCSSGSGEILPGEGIRGLTRAWLRAGAHNVVATLWPTPDHSGELLQSFYRHLGSVNEGGFSQAPEKALRLAQIDMLRSRTWRSRPGYWAAYFVVSRN